MRRLPVSRAGLLAVSMFTLVRAMVWAVLLLVADSQGRSAGSLLTGWDADWYARIASRGYGFVRIHEDGRRLADYALFPLYPMAERVVAGALGIRHVAAGLLISAVASVVAAVGVFAVARRVLTVPAAVIATVLWAALPISVVQSMAYSESLFTALSVWSLYAVLRQRWFVAALLACAAGMTRPSGVAVVLAVVLTALIPWVRHLRTGSSAGLNSGSHKRLVAAVVAPMGLLGYLAWVARETRQPGGYFSVAHAWGNDFDAGVAFTGWVGKELTDQPVAGMAIVVGLAVLVGLCCGCVRQRLPLPLLVYTFALVILSVTASGYFGSKPRYLLPAFPLLFPMAAWLAKRRPWIGAVALTGFTLAAVTYAPIWLLGPGPP